MVDGNLFPYTGAITFADPSYNPTTGTFLLRATVNNPGGRAAAQPVRARAAEGRDPAERDRRPAARGAAERERAISCGSSTRRTRRSFVPVVVGEWKGDGWLITDGLNNGDKVVVDGGVRLTQGRAGEGRARTRRQPRRTAPSARARRRAPYPAAAAVQRGHPVSRPGQATLDTGRAARHTHRGGGVRRHRHADQHHRLRRQDRQRRGQRRAREEARAWPCATSSWRSASSPGASCSCPRSA